MQIHTGMCVGGLNAQRVCLQVCGEVAGGALRLPHV